MNAKNSYRKFQKEQKKINDLEKSNARFRRVFTEYETMSDDLWQLESSDAPAIPDDYVDSLRIQQSFLEDEVQDWLNSDSNFLQ